MNQPSVQIPQKQGIVAQSELIAEDGFLAKTGWPTQPLLHSNKQAIQSSTLRQKDREFYGLYCRTLVLDDGSIIEIDGIHGHAEDIQFKW